MAELGPGKPARGTSTGRPILVLFDALGRRGTLRLLWELREDRRLTFRALVAACESNPGVLNTRIKELRELDLITHDGTGYCLTDHGAALGAQLGELNQWAKKWGAAVERQRNGGSKQAPP